VALEAEPCRPQRTLVRQRTLVPRRRNRWRAAASATGGGVGAGATGDGATARATAGATPIRHHGRAPRSLDKQLDDSLGAFDAHLRQEQQKVAQDRDARQATCCGYDHFGRF